MGTASEKLYRNTGQKFGRLMKWSFLVTVEWLVSDSQSVSQKCIYWPQKIHRRKKDNLFILVPVDFIWTRTFYDCFYNFLIAVS